MTRGLEQSPAPGEAAGEPNAGAAPGAARSRFQLPPDGLILIPVRNMVLFPGLVAPITIGRER